MLPESCRRYPCYALELCAQVSRARIPHAIGNFVERQFVIHQELFDAFYSLCDIEFFYRSTVYCREEFGRRIVIHIQPVGNILREVCSLPLLAVMRQLYYGYAYLFGQAVPAVVYQLKPKGVGSPDMTCNKLCRRRELVGRLHRYGASHGIHWEGDAARKISRPIKQATALRTCESGMRSRAVAV